MTLEAFLFPAYYIAAIIVAAMNAKTLGACVVFALSLQAVYPDEAKASIIFLFFGVSIVLASFRD